MHHIPYTVLNDERKGPINMCICVQIDGLMYIWTDVQIMDGLMKTSTAGHMFSV